MRAGTRRTGYHGARGPKPVPGLRRGTAEGVPQPVPEADAAPGWSRLVTRHGVLDLPAYLPDATRGVVRTVDTADLAACGVRAVVISTYHLMLTPGVRVLRAVGGVHRFMGWDGPVVTDSGGFQVLSLIRENPGLGGLSRDGAVFRTEAGGRRRILTPEKSIQLQFQLGGDVMMCLDDCTRPEEPAAEQRASVERTIAWARRCRAVFDRLASERDWGPGGRPLLFAVIQGGDDAALRRACAGALAEIGFDGYGLGGWPVDERGRLLAETLQLTADLMPAGHPRFALGVGKPENVVACARMGYDLFDCTLPTRDARHRRIYNFRSAEPASVLEDGFYEYLHILDDVYLSDGRPLSAHCGCPCCRRYSRAYLHHLFAVGDPLALRLATLHNLTFYTDLLARLRAVLPPRASA